MSHHIKVMPKRAIRSNIFFSPMNGSYNICNWRYDEVAGWTHQCMMHVGMGYMLWHKNISLHCWKKCTNHGCLHYVYCPGLHRVLVVPSAVTRWLLRTLWWLVPFHLWNYQQRALKIKTLKIFTFWKWIRIRLEKIKWNFLDSWEY